MNNTPLKEFCLENFLIFEISTLIQNANTSWHYVCSLTNSSSKNIPFLNKKIWICLALNIRVNNEAIHLSSQYITDQILRI